MLLECLGGVNTQNAGSECEQRRQIGGCDRRDRTCGSRRRRRYIAEVDEEVDYRTRLPKTALEEEAMDRRPIRAVGSEGPLHAALPQPRHRRLEQRLCVLLVPRQAPGNSDAAVRLNRAVANDLAAGDGVEPRRRIEVAGSGAPLHFLRGGRLELRQGAGGGVV